MGCGARIRRCEVRYAPGAHAGGADTSSIADAEAVARDADAIVLVLGEDGERTGEAESRASLELPFAQMRLAQRIRAPRGGKPLVVVLMNGRPLAIPWIADSMPAIVESWYSAATHGDAIADVLFGATRLRESFRSPSRARRDRCRCISRTRTPGGRRQPKDKYTTGYNDLPIDAALSVRIWLELHARSATISVLGSRDGIRAGDSLGVSHRVEHRRARRATKWCSSICATMWRAWRGR